MVICLQLMPLPLTVSCFNKIQIFLPFLYWLTWVVQDKEQLNRCASVLSFCNNQYGPSTEGNTCTCTAKWPSVKYLARRDTTGFYSTQTVTAVILRSNSFLRSNDFAKTLLHYLMLSLSSAFTSRMSSAIQWQRHQLSAVAAAHPPAWSVGSC